MYARRTCAITAPAVHDAGTSKCWPVRRPVGLRVIDGNLARLRRLLGAGRYAEVSTGAHVLRVSTGRAQLAAFPPASRALCLDTPHGRIAMTPSRDLVRVLTGIDVPDDESHGGKGDHSDERDERDDRDREDDATPLQRLAFEFALQALPSDWLDLFGATTLLPGLDLPAGTAALTLALVVTDGRMAIDILLRGSADALLAALSRPAWRGMAQRALLPEDWRLRLPVVLGRTTLPVATARALTVGDVVIVTVPEFALDGHGTMRLGARAANCMLTLGNQPALKVTEWDSTNPTTASTNMFIQDGTLPQPVCGLEPGSDLEGEAALADVPVMLSFELGVIELTLRDLSALAPGYVLPIGGLPPPSVQIRCAGRLIGAGELVEVDGRLAVEITRLGAVT